MKLRNLLQLAGIRGRARHYGYRIEETALSDGRRIRYARWLHPSEKDKHFSLEQVEMFAPYLGAGDFAIDIGAHSGDSTLPMALAVGALGHVLALEPNPYLYHVLEKNARANRAIAPITTMMAAAMPEQCFTEFEYSDAGYCNGGRHEGISALSHGHAFKLEVFGVALADELRSDFAHLLPRLRFIKIDAEGYDLYVLESLRSIIETHRPTIKAEVFKKTDDDYRRRLFGFFESLDYRVHLCDAEPLGKGRALAYSDSLSGRHFDILCVPLDPIPGAG